MTEYRKREEERAEERVEARRRLKELEEFGDTEKFVTAAYKRKLQEWERLDAEDAQQAAVEAAQARAAPRLLPAAAAGRDVAAAETVAAAAVATASTFASAAVTVNCAAPRCTALAHESTRATPPHAHPLEAWIWIHPRYPPEFALRWKPCSDSDGNQDRHSLAAENETLSRNSARNLGTFVWIFKTTLLSQDVRKKGNLDDFYQNLMHDNVTMGSMVKKARRLGLSHLVLWGFQGSQKSSLGSPNPGTSAVTAHMGSPHASEGNRVPSCHWSVLSAAEELEEGVWGQLGLYAVRGSSRRS